MELRRTGHLRSASVAGALGEVPRELFVADIAADQGLEAVYRDEALPAKVDPRGRWLSSSSQPSIMALMLEQLSLEPGQRVLEIGAGTGYNAALLRHLVGAAGRVTTIDIDPELARRARSALRRSGYAAKVFAGDGREGFPHDAPYDRIVVTASVAEIPNAWLDQLRPGGRLQLPLRLDSEALPHVIPVLELRDGALQSVTMTWGGFMPLHGGEGGQGRQPESLHAGQWADGEHSSLIRITGPALDRLSDAERRQLLALVLEGPRSREPRGHVTTQWPSPPGLLLHLTQRIPASCRLELHAIGRHGIGLVSADGRSVAVAVAATRVRRFGRGKPPDARERRELDRWWIDSYGTPDLTGELEEFLLEWQALRRSGRTRLHIEVRRSSTSSSALTKFAWRSAGPTRT